MSQARFKRRNPDRPRRVRGGIKLSATDMNVGRNAIALGWSNAIICSAGELARSEGFDYARRGQIVSMHVEPGLIEARVQGRRPKAYRVRVVTDMFTESDWERLVETIAREARSTATLVVGGLSEDVLRETEKVGLPLTPPVGEKVRVSCNCGTPDGVACKHTVAVGLALAESLNTEPAQVFRLRGMPEDEFIERLRMRRNLQAGGGAAETLPEIDLRERRDGERPLEEEADRFWDVGVELDEVITKLGPPEVAHPLVRRLGPSPFDDCRFPLVGLLATCCDVVTEATLREQMAPTEEARDGAADDEEDSGHEQST